MRFMLSPYLSNFMTQGSPDHKDVRKIQLFNNQKQQTISNHNFDKLENSVETKRRDNSKDSFNQFASLDFRHIEDTYLNYNSNAVRVECLRGISPYQNSNYQGSPLRFNQTQNGGNYFNIQDKFLNSGSKDDDYCLSQPQNQQLSKDCSKNSKQPPQSRSHSQQYLQKTLTRGLQASENMNIFAINKDKDSSQQLIPKVLRARHDEASLDSLSIERLDTNEDQEDRSPLKICIFTSSFTFQAFNTIDDPGQSYQNQYSSIQTPVHNKKQSASVQHHQKQILAQNQASQNARLPFKQQLYNKSNSPHTTISNEQQIPQQQQQQLSNQEIRAIQSQFQEFQHITQTTKHLESQLSKFKKLVEQKREFLKQMDKDIQNKQKINEKRDKIYKEIKTKQTGQEDKVKVKKQQLILYTILELQIHFKLRVKLELYQKKKHQVQQESEHLLDLEKELRTLKETYDTQLQNYNISRTQFDQQKQQFLDIKDTKNSKYTQEIEQLKFQLSKLQDKNIGLEQKSQQFGMKQKNLHMNDMDLKELEIKIGEEQRKLESKRQEMLEEEKAVKMRKNELQARKEIELLASEELKKTECLLFDKENREYDTETKSNYCISELKKKLRELEAKHEEVIQRELILKERMKIEGKIELELAGLEFNQDRHCKLREDQQKQFEIEMKILDREETLRQRELDIRKKESKICVRQSQNSITKVKGIFQDIDQWSEMLDTNENLRNQCGKSIDIQMHPNKENLLLTRN